MPPFLPMQIIGPTIRELNKLLFSLNINNCSINYLNEQVRLESFETTHKETIEFYKLKYEILRDSRKLKFVSYENIPDTRKIIITVYENDLKFTLGDPSDFLEKEEIIISHINKEFPGWLEQYFRNPVIRRVYLTIKYTNF